MPFHRGGVCAFIPLMKGARGMLCPKGSGRQGDKVGEWCVRVGRASEWVR